MTYVNCPYPLMIQAFIFSKADFTLDSAMRWLRFNDVDASGTQFLETGQSWRARQHEPYEFVPGSFRTIRLGQGKSRVQAVIGCPKSALHGRRKPRRRRT